MYLVMLTRRPGELSTPKNMNMNVIHRLTSFLTIVDHNSTNVSIILSSWSRYIPDSGSPEHSLESTQMSKMLVI